jgi:hypothetical protein
MVSSPLWTPTYSVVIGGRFNTVRHFERLVIQTSMIQTLCIVQLIVLLFRVEEGQLFIAV